MAFAILSILILTAATMFVSFKNKVSRIFVVYFVGIVIMLFASVMFISKFSTYDHYTTLDYNIYLWLNNLRFRPTSISRLFRFGTAVIMLSSLLLLFMLTKINTVIKVLAVIPFLIYIPLNDPAFAYRTFLAIHSLDPTVWDRVIIAVMNFNIRYSLYVCIAYMLIPFWAIYVYSRNTRIIIKQRDSLLSLIYLTIANLFIVFFYVTGPFETMMLTNIDLLGFPMDNLRWNFYTITQPIIVMLLLTLLFITIYCKPFGSFSLLSKRRVMKESRALNETITLIFHSYKNMLFAIERLSHQGTNIIDKNPDAAKENLEDIHSMSKTALDSLTKNLDMLRKVDAAPQTINIKSCIDTTAEMILAPEKIKVIFDIQTDDFTVKGDEKHMTECFVNLFSNARDAIRAKNTRFPFVKIKMFCEDGLLCIEILDNGCGIDKKDIKKIFRSFYSTKQNDKNWGIGLNYTKKVLDIYAGSINVRSKLGRYTWFQIVLPLYRKRRRLLWEK